MPIPFTCLTCGGNFKAPDAAAGRKVKCPKCSAAISFPANIVTRAKVLPASHSQIVAPTPPIEEKPNLAPAPAASSSSNRTVQDYRDCPFCSEEILVNAKKCRHCLEVLDVTMRAAEEVRRESKRESRRSRPQSVTVRQSNQMIVEGNKLPFNHGMHLIIDLFTCGAWFPIHLLCWALH